MQNIYDYKTLVSKDPETMDKQVIEYLNRGYKLYGDPYSNPPFILQAMIKISKDRYRIENGDENEQ